MRIVKSVSFNLNDPVEREIFEIANKGGLFSKNAKRMMATYLFHYPILKTNKEDEGEQEEEVDFDSFAFDEEDEEDEEV